jgi:DDE superfamily endonuclease
LILDDYDAHKTDEVLEACKQHNIERILVPAGQTAHLQPLDVSVNSQIKQKARKSWVKDKEERPLQADTLSRAAERVDVALRDIPKQSIKESFDKAVPVLGRKRKLPR